MAWTDRQTTHRCRCHWYWRVVLGAPVCAHLTQVLLIIPLVDVASKQTLAKSLRLCLFVCLFIDPN